MSRRLSLLLMAFAATSAVAQPAGQTLPQAQAEQALQQQRLARSEREAGELRAEINALSVQLAELTIAQGRGGDSLSTGRVRLDALNDREARLMARMGANQNALSRLLGALQMYGRNPPPALLVHPDDAKKAVRTAILVRALTPELERRARGFAGEAEAALQTRREAASASELLFTTESDMAERAAQIEALIAQKTALEQHLSADARSAERDLVALAARVQSLRSDPRAVYAPPPVASPLGRLLPPAPGQPLRRYGQASPRGGVIEGWTWPMTAGQAVQAPGPSRVEYAGPVSGWDNVLILDIGEDYHLVLAGVGDLAVVAGDMVTARQPLGRMARGGGAAELYVEVRRGGEPVDPARFFAAINP